MKVLWLAMPALLSSLCNSIANTFWKRQFSNEPLNTTSLKSLFFSVWHWRIFAGVAFYGISMFLFFYLLSHYKLSQVVPYLAATYIFNYMIASIVFKEQIAATQIAGIFLIVIGIIVCNCKA